MGAPYVVTLQNLSSGVCFQKEFWEYNLCRTFVEKCKRSKKVRLVSYPNFRW